MRGARSSSAHALVVSRGKRALLTLTRLCADGDADALDGAASAISEIVCLLGPRSPPEVQQSAAGALKHLALRDAYSTTIAAAGAIPLLVQLLELGSP
ncbi:hypothetical protein FOA52_015865 [Chlamydomonas sp. UWO 241]|nr:hypothetical protein FOA52_015865 [Chlamydomonas sp. UWO 241]